MASCFDPMAPFDSTKRSSRFGEECWTFFRLLIGLNWFDSNLFTHSNSFTDACRQFQTVRLTVSCIVFIIQSFWLVHFGCWRVAIRRSLPYEPYNPRFSWTRSNESASEGIRTVFFVLQINSNQSISRLFRCSFEHRLMMPIWQMPRSCNWCIENLIFKSDNTTMWLLECLWVRNRVGSWWWRRKQLGVSNRNFRLTTDVLKSPIWRIELDDVAKEFFNAQKRQKSQVRKASTVACWIILKINFLII